MAKNIKVYTYSELSDAAKEKALEEYVQHCLSYWWWDLEDIFKDIMDALGFIVKNMYFSLFDQGSGACFTGSYYYESKWREKLEERTGDEFWFNIGVQLEALQKQYDYSYSVIIEHNSRYCHEHTMYLKESSVEQYDDDDGAYIGTFDAPDEADEEFLGICRDIARHLYKWIQEEYEYQTGEGAIAQLEEGEHYFFDTGKFYGYIP